MHFGILGPLDVRSGDGSPLDPGGPRPRTLLTLLLLDAGRSVPTARLTDGLYGDEPPSGAANALQSQVSRLRRRLGLEIAGTATGYRLAVDPDTVDVHRFERLAREGRRALAAGDAGRAAGLLREGLGLWRGPALADLPDGQALVARLDELRFAAVQDRIEADLALGGGSALVPELRELIAAHPLGERLYGQLMRALHAAGRPAEALTVYEAARRTLADELGTDPSAELSALHRELLQGREPVRQQGVPAQLTRFVGREEELARIDELLARTRLVTLTGPGGAGKTRLAIEAARAWADRARKPGARGVRGDGSGEDVCYVELAPLGDGSRLPYALLGALGVRDGLRAQGTDATGRLLTALEDRTLLLVLDNCEHVVEEAARITALLLGACPGVRVLATSRESLGITGEALCPVPPLPAGPAVRLFLDRAAAVRPDAVPGADHGRVAAVCAALDGLPLAIELAAARLRTLTLGELSVRLTERLGGDAADGRFRVLSRGDRTKAPRHRTLRAVVEWSWELLDDEERELARRLTVFPSGAGLDAVEAVCGVAYPEDLLASLAEKSFVEVADGRYGMLQTIRAFCAERLAEEGEREGLRDAHAAYFLRLAEEAEPLLRGGGQLPWLARLDAEHGNLEAALRHLAGSATGSALRLMAALSWFWRLRGLHGEQTGLARELLAAVGPEPPDGLVEEYVLCVLNTVTGNGDDPAEPERIERVGALLQGLDRRLRLPFTMVLWALAGGPRPADRQRARIQIGDDPWGLALLDVAEGFQELFTARTDASEAAFGRALDGFRRTGDRWGMANCLDPLGMFADWRGERARALELIDEGLGHVGELAAPEETADLLLRRAAVLLRLGDPALAEGHLRRAEALARTAGVPDKVAGARRGLGDAARRSGDPARARVHYEEALEACAANWFSVGETARILVGLGRTAVADGQVDEARERFAQARALLAESAAVTGAELAECAEALAAVAETPERAAVLLGAADALRGTLIAGDPDVAPVHGRVCEELSPQAYDRAFARGRALGAAALDGP
ncbi:ATP-binding protein [Streptomyces sp. NPDC002004]